MARRIVRGALIAGILGVTAFTLPSYFLYILSLAGIWAIAAIGLDLLTGVAGQISIGHAGFMAIGAYTVALLSLRLEVPFWLALPAAGLLNALIGLALGLPALRLSGPYLAIATLGFGVAVVEILRRWEPVTGGFMGLKVPPPALGPWSLRSDAAQYLLIGTLLVLLAGIAIRLIRSPFGRAWIALRDREAAAQAAGISLAQDAGGLSAGASGGVDPGGSPAGLHHRSRLRRLRGGGTGHPGAWQMGRFGRPRRGSLRNRSGGPGGDPHLGHRSRRAGGV
jgi:branched-chain amino acid transport system permease protein